ncbi:hypothetical protein LAD74_01510 [Mycoplasma sp. U97]|uniref:SGNH/GDSL hydrolase family protein n=1 Tax=Mycoplasma tauri TaxID=547987 RepID=UPI001CBDA873|nr:SGNH/GDSL hydrolase family protein [Mycoplasma tauri]MBZ4212666.1 hypothetical protein [Mycoplasma tauri]
MKIKLKPILITGCISITTTLALAIGISYIPFGDKKLEYSDGNIQPNDDKNLKVPGLPNKDKNNLLLDEPNNNFKIKASDRAKSPDFITLNNKINYVALGDSISAGFDSELDKDYSGNFNQKGEIEGISFPAYLAQFLQSADKNRFSSFFNHSFTGSTLKQWSIILDWENEKNKISDSDLKELKQTLQIQDIDKINKFSETVKDSLGKSNLVTITLGANDFIELFLEEILNIPIFEIIKQFRNNDLNYTELVLSITNSLKGVFKKLNQRIDHFANLLKKYTKTSNVNFISYPLPLAHLFKILDKKVFGDSPKFSIGNLLINILNDEIKFKVNQNKFYFINSYNQDFWNLNLRKLIPTLFDIHPGSIGYKRMAGDVFVKLISPSRDVDEMNKKGIKWSSDFVKSDFDTYLHQIEFTDPFKVINNIFGNSIDKFTLDTTNDKRYNQYLEIRKQGDKWYFERVLKRYESLFINKLLDFVINSEFFKKADIDGKLYTFLTKNNYENINQIKQWFTKSGFIPSKLLEIQKIYFNTDWDKDGIPGATSGQFNEYFMNSIKENLFNEEMLIKMMSSFFNIEFIKTHNDEFASLLASFIQQIIKQNINNDVLDEQLKNIDYSKFNNYLDKNSLKSLINIFANSESLKYALTDLFVAISKDASKFSKAKTFKELLNILVTNPDLLNLAKNRTKQLIKEISSSNEFTNILARILKGLSIEYPQIFEGIDLNNIAKAITVFVNNFDLIDNEFEIIKILTNQLFAEIPRLLNGQKIEVQELLKNIKNEIKSKINSSTIKENILKVLKIVRKMQIGEYSNDLNKLVINLLKHFNISELVSNEVYKNPSSQINALLSKEEFKNIFTKVLYSSEFTELSNELVKLAINYDEQKVENSKTLNELVKYVVKDFVSSQGFSKLQALIKKIFSIDEIKSIITNLFAKYLPGINLKITGEDVSKILIYLLENDNVKELIKNFLQKGVLTSEIDLFNFDIEKSVKLWLKDPENRKFVNEKLVDLLKNITSQNEIQTIIANLIYEFAKTKEGLLNKIDKDKFIDLVKKFVGSFNNFESKLNITSKIADVILNELSSSGKNINETVLKDNLEKLFAELFENDKWETTLVSFLKALVNPAYLSNNEELVSQLFLNTLLVVLKKENLGTKLFDNLPKSAKDVISQQINGDDINNILIGAISDEDTTKQIISGVLSTLVTHNDELQSATSFLDILKIYLKNQDETILESNFEKIFESIINHEKTRELIRGLIVSNMKPYKIDLESEANTAFLNDLIKDSPKLLKDLKIIPNLVKGLKDELLKINHFSELKSNWINVILEKLKISNFDFWSTILRSSIISKHSKVLKEDIQKIIEGITTNEELVDKFINDFNLAKMLVKQGLSEENAIKFWKGIFKSENIKNILNLIVSEVLDNAQGYAETGSWIKFIEKFFNSDNVNKAKEHLKEWYKELANDHDYVFETVGALLAKSFRDNGYSINQEQEKIIQDFVKSFAKAVPNSRILNDIIDSVFKELKQISKESNLTLTQRILNAVKKGALAFISSEDGEKINLSKIFHNAEEINKILSNIDPKAYSDFINLMFEIAPASSNSGLFNIMFNSSANNSSSKVEVGWSGFRDLVNGKLEELISVIISPLFKHYLNELRNKEHYSNIMDVKKNVTGYHSIWRVYAFLNAIMYSNAGSFFYWNATNLTAEAKTRFAFAKAYENVISGGKYNDVIDKYKSNLGTIGLSNRTQANNTYWAGTQKFRFGPASNSLNNWNYARDYLLVYIYYQDSKDYKYNKDTLKRDILINDLKKGFMPIGNN